MTYKPCTTAQYRIMEYLRETFETSLCLIYPSRPNAMVLEDQFGEKLEFIIYRLHGYESSDYDDMHSNSYLAGCMAELIFSRFASNRGGVGNLSAYIIYDSGIAQCAVSLFSCV